MPGAGTHTTTIQFLAQALSDSAAGQALGDPTKNADWSKYGTEEALQSRYAILGAMGPDFFYAMLDYGGSVQQFEDVVIKIAGTLQCVGHLSERINQIVSGALDELTQDAWGSISASAGLLQGILLDSVFGAVIDNFNFWNFFLPRREVDDYRYNWYWADYLHYVKTGCFAKKLLDNCLPYKQHPDPVISGSLTTRCLTAYALGYLTHYVSDTIGHSYVNRIVQSPWRNCWQRHHLVENFIDAYVWDHWHNGGADPTQIGGERGLDLILTDPAKKTSPAPLHFARLNDLCNIGSLGIDPIIDAAVSAVCQAIDNGLNVFTGPASMPALQAPDHPVFITWTEFMADAIIETYPPGQIHPVKLASSTLVPRPDPEGYPSPDDIAAAYGAYRLVLSLATGDDVTKPAPPDVAGDLWKIIKQAWDNIKKDIGSIPPLPSASGSQGLSLQGIWDAVTKYLNWLGQAGAAVLQALGDLLAGMFKLGSAVTITEPLKIAFYLLNSILYSIYDTVRMTLVMSGYSAPFTEDLTGNWGPVGDLRSLWTVMDEAAAGHYPVEPIVSERDFATNSAHPFAPYRPYFKPTDLAPVNVEFPPTTLNKEVAQWSTPDDMMNWPAGSDSMFTAEGLAPATTVPLLNPDGSKLADIETFDGSQLSFGGILANCAQALGTAVDYLSGGELPEGWMLPDYNLDSDRGYAWPCWDVDYSAPNSQAPYPWNGCDPFPADSQATGDSPQPPRPPDNSLFGTDPWGNPRSGKAWVNATALNEPGDCQYFDFPFPSILIDASNSDFDSGKLQGLNAKSPTFPNPGQLTNDYYFAPPELVNATIPEIKIGDRDDYLLNDFNGTTWGENDGRLIDDLRVPIITTSDPYQLLILAVAWSLSDSPTDQLKGTALAQLAVTGRRAFESFAKTPPQDQQLELAVLHKYPETGQDLPKLQAAVQAVLDTAYRAVWAIRSNDPGWRAFRPQLGWIAAAGFDDSPHRPVNVPTAPYPQFDITFSVPRPDGSQKQVTTRYMVATAETFVGPDDLALSSFINPSPDVLHTPAAVAPFPTDPAPRTVPDDQPAIPPEGEIIIYIHGGGSRAGEAVDMANWLIVEGVRAGKQYTVISFDLPNSAYGEPFDITDMLGTTTYHPTERHVLTFEQDFIINFIEALDQQVGNVRTRVAAIMGGSLGGNMSLLLTGRYDSEHPYLQTVVAWSATATSQAYYLGVIPQIDLAAYLAKLKEKATSLEPWTDHAIESQQYLNDMYYNPLVDKPGLPYIPPQPIMWYRRGLGDDWLDWKKSLIPRTRFDRYEIYSPMTRHWAIAIDLEQIGFSFQDNQSGWSIVSTPQSSTLPPSYLLLASGDQDNFDPNAIYNSTIDVTRMIRRTVRGKAEFWADTGHSIHNERPHLFSKEIVYFLCNLDAGDSPNGRVVTTVPKAAFAPTEIGTQY